MKKYLLVIAIFSCILSFGQGVDQAKDSIQIRTIYTQALTKGKSYNWLAYLSNNIGARLAGSEGDKKAVAWGKKELEKFRIR